MTLEECIEVLQREDISAQKIDDDRTMVRGVPFKNHMLIQVVEDNHEEGSDALKIAIDFYLSPFRYLSPRDH